MRDIEFRAWDKELARMLVGNNQYGLDEPGFREEQSSAGAFTRLWEALARFKNSNRFVLMQYTGLKDKNGKKIFEGDTIECKQFSHGHFIGDVIYRNEKCCYQTHQGYYFSEYPVAIIGNIHEGVT